MIDNYSAIREFFLNDFSVKLPTTSGMRFASLSMAIFFALGLIFIRFLKEKKIESKQDN